MTASQTLNCFAIQLLPISMMTIVQNTQAFWTVLLGWMINNEKFHRVEAVGILACFSGVLMMAVSEDPAAEEGTQQNTYGSFARLIGVLVMVFVAFNDGLTFVMARTMKQIHFSVMMFWFSAIGLVLILTYTGLHAIYFQTVPMIFTYNFDQM